MAIGSSAVCLEWCAGRALATGASEDEIADVLLAIAPVAGLGRIVAAAPEVAIALGAPLVYHSGRPGAEIYLAFGSPGLPGFYPVDSALALQFRRGHLTGWKKDWQVGRPVPFF